ncbi:ParB/RepB/Spo0J family partition protein [Chitiniphilus shinanonensis]|uniref:ParB/RepB/Spo0J family partition protein n=1 Tax=Chitiniphilus shinanonensis TaxID=553088 RepID=UPI003067FCE1
MSNKKFSSPAKYIRENGVQYPLVVTEYNGRLYVLDGHHRLFAAPRAGIRDVPVRMVDLPYSAYKTPADLTYTPYGYQLECKYGK